MSFGGFNRQSGSPMSEINTTPLVDVMLVLLIIFIITAPIITGNIAVNLPSAKSAPSIQKDVVINLVLNEKGELFLNERQILEENLVELLKIEAAQNPDAQLKLNADLNTRYEKITQIMSKVNQAGITKIGFVTKL
jgi:biopolymer transport protein ExbD